MNIEDFITAYHLAGNTQRLIAAYHLGGVGAVLRTIWAIARIEISAAPAVVFFFLGMLLISIIGLWIYGLSHRF